MAAGPASNVVSIRRGRTGAPAALDPTTIVLHAVACDDDLADVMSVVAALQRRPSFRGVAPFSAPPQPCLTVPRRAAGPASNVVSIRRGRTGAPAALDPTTIVLHAVACDDDLADVMSVVAALQRRPSFRQIVVHA